MTNIVVDPNNDTADTDTENNTFPRVDEESRFDRFSKNADVKVNPEGTWEYTAKTPQGSQEGTMTISKKKNKLEGILTGSNGSYPMQDISVNGNELTFYFVIEQGQAIKIETSVIILDDEFLGKMNIGTMGSYDLSGKRQ